ncbi:MAG: hypothetical protein EU535_04185, partial [Promethearchaeota archaeon]
LGDDYPFEYTWYNVQTKQPVSDEFIKKEMIKLPEKKFNNKYRRKFEQLIGASRFLTKIWNAYRFLGINLDKIKLSDIDIEIKRLTAIESYILLEFNKNLETITNYFDGYNWHEAFTILRPFFWNEICDNYIEAIKFRFYSDNVEERTSALKNALNLFYNFLTIFAVIMPFISEEIYNILFKKFRKIKSIHLEKWPQNYEKISEELAKKGKLGLDIIKILRNYKSKLQIPLNKDLERIIILANNTLINDIKELKEDIKNTIRINNLEVMNKNKENTIKSKPDLKEISEELGITFYISL